MHTNKTPDLQLLHKKQEKTGGKKKQLKCVHENTKR